LHRIESPASTRAWLVRVTTHAAWRVQRKAPRADLVADVEDQAALDDTEEIGMRRAGSGEARVAVRAALAGPAPRERPAGAPHRPPPPALSGPPAPGAGAGRPGPGQLTPRRAGARIGRARAHDLWC